MTTWTARATPPLPAPPRSAACPATLRHAHSLFPARTGHTSSAGVGVQLGKRQKVEEAPREVLTRIRRELGEFEVGQLQATAKLRDECMRLCDLALRQYQ